MQTEEPTAKPANSPTYKIMPKKRLDWWKRKKKKRRYKAFEIWFEEFIIYRSGVSRDRWSDKHHDEGDNDLYHECLPLRPRRRRRSKIRNRVEHLTQNKGRNHGPGELCRPVKGHLQAAC